MPRLKDTTPDTKEQTHQTLAQENLRLKAEIQWLKEQLGLAKHRLYAPTTEASPPGQEAMLFNETETNAAADLPETASETITYTRRKFTGQSRLQDGVKLQPRRFRAVVSYPP